MFQFLKSNGDVYEWAKKLVQDLNKPDPAAVPVGTVSFYAGSAPPLGWLLADGAQYMTKQYPILGLMLGGGETFNVPNIAAPNGTIAMIKGA